MPTIEINASTTDTSSPASARSIWKRNTSTPDLYDGPSSKLEAVGFHLAAEWSEADGVQFWGNLERDSEEYTLSEVRKIHSAIGRLLEKVAAEPKPIDG